MLWNTKASTNSTWILATHFDDDTVLVLLTCDDLQTVKACTVVHRVEVAGRDRVKAITSGTRQRTKTETV